MSYVHTDFFGSWRKSYIPHTTFLDFRLSCEWNDENVQMTIALYTGRFDL